MSEAQNTVALPPHPEIEKRMHYMVFHAGGRVYPHSGKRHIGLVHPDRPDAVPTDLMHIIDS